MARFSTPAPPDPTEGIKRRQHEIRIHVDFEPVHRLSSDLTYTWVPQGSDVRTPSDAFSAT